MIDFYCLFVWVGEWSYISKCTWTSHLLLVSVQPARWCCNRPGAAAAAAAAASPLCMWKRLPFLAFFAGLQMNVAVVSETNMTGIRNIKVRHLNQGSDHSYQAPVLRPQLCCYRVRLLGAANNVHAPLSTSASSTLNIYLYIDVT